MTKQYVDAVRNSAISMRPVLPLGQPVDLGHVGTIGDDGSFQHRGTLTSMLGLNSLGGELAPQQSPVRVSITSGRSVRVNIGARARTDGQLAQFSRLAGKASIDFGSQNSFFAAVDGLQIRQLREPQLLLNAVLSAYALDRWDKDWAFIHRIGVARHLTAILASEADTTVLLKASAKVAAGAVADVDLATGFKFVASTKAITQITGGRNTSAFYDAYRVKDSFFKKPQVEQYRVAVPFGTDLELYPTQMKRVKDPAESYTRA